MTQATEPPMPPEIFGKIEQKHNISKSTKRKDYYTIIVDDEKIDIKWSEAYAGGVPGSIIMWGPYGQYIWIYGINEKNWDHLMQSISLQAHGFADNAKHKREKAKQRRAKKSDIGDKK